MPLGGGHYELLPAWADLVGNNVDVIAASGGKMR
jgi:hypothetical protein